MTASTLEPPTILSPPNAANYRDFRMVAEWASAIRGNCLDFTYDDDTGRMSVELVEDGPMLTPPNASRPVVTQVEFTVSGADAPLFLDGRDCSALFWSESAVEKFLFPRFASAGADDAARFLGRLSDAWYGYPGRVVQVCALAYQYGVNAQLSQLSLEAAVGLVCLERASGTLTLMGLNEFERKYPVGAARGMSPHSPLLPELKRLTGWQADRVDSVLAREAAELVSGLRGHYVWFTLEGSMLTPWICPTEEPVDRPEGVVMHGVSVTVRPDRPAPYSVEVAVNGSADLYPVVTPCEPPCEDAMPDAMFWTDGAVEKLLLPYYASVKGRTAPYFTALLMGKWDGSIPADLLVDSNGPPIVVTPREQPFLDTTDRAADDDTSSVFAITHLPRSEYVSDGSPALENRTALLTFEAGFTRHSLFGSALLG